MIRFLQPDKCSAKDFLQRLQKISNKELATGITDKFGNGIIVNVSAKDELTCIRFIVYYHINDELTNLTIKKFKYCIEN